MLNETYRAMLNNKSVIRETFMYGRQRAAQIGSENVFDYSLGNPSVPCPPEFTEAMQTLLAQEEPVSLHGYCPSQGDPGFRTAVAAHLTETFGLPYAQKHIFPTTGAAGAIAHAIRAVTQPGDEVLTFAPYFGEYDNYVMNVGGVLHPVPPNPPDFLPDVDALSACITPKTKAIIINSPNNPTGVIYDAGTIEKIAAVLRQKSAEYGTDIYIIADEPYRELAYDGVEVPYIPNFYENTIVAYSFSKSLSLPGDRIGYLVIPSTVSDFAEVSMGAAIANRVLGFVNAPALQQMVVARCCEETTDVAFYNANRELLYNALQEYGYTCAKPQGAFYLFVKALEDADKAFCEKAKEYRLLVTPGSAFGCKGYVRISYCVSRETIENSLPSFKALAESYKK